MSSSPCCRFHPAEVAMPHRSDFGTPFCLRPPEAGSALGSGFSRPHLRSLSLRPDDSWSPPRETLSIGFRILVSRHPAIQNHRASLLPPKPVMTPLFPRSGPGESGSPMSRVILRCYDFPARIPGHLLVSLPGSTLPSLGSCLVACAHAPGRTEGIFRARVIVQPATHLPTCSHVDVGGISQVPRRSILCLCLVPGPRPNRRSLAY